jgi:hypothetical protein
MNFKAILATTCSLLLSTSLALGQECPAAAAAAKEGSKCSSACSEGGKGKCCQEKTAATAACHEAKLCPTETVAALGEKMVLPAMGYKVGDEVVTCCGTASELAKGDDAKIQFVVNGKTYSNKTEAMLAYAESLDQFYTEMLAVEYVVGDSCVKCPTTAKELAAQNGGKMQYKVAAYTFGSKESAEKALAAAKERSEKISFKRKVGDKEYCCSSMAGDAAKKENKPVEYVVGDTKVESEPAARVAMVRARIVAAAEVLKQASNS